MMAKNIGKDKEKSSAFSDKFRNLFGFKSGTGGHSVGQHPQLSHSQLANMVGRHKEYNLASEHKNEVTKRFPLSTRLKTLKELEEVVENKRLVDHTCELLICETLDLLDEGQPVEARHSIWRFYKCLVRGQSEKLNDLRFKFLQLVKDHCHYDEDVPLRLELLMALTENGKNIDYCQNEIANFMVGWFDKIVSVNKLSEFLTLLTNLIKFNAPYFDQEVIAEVIKKTCWLTNKVGAQEELWACYNLFDVILCYSFLPPESLTPFSIILCKGLNVTALFEICWKVMRNMLGTKLGHSCVTNLCHVLRDETNHNDLTLMRGSIYVLTECLWGSKPVTSLKQSPNCVLPAFIKALDCHNLSVALEVTTSILKLLEHDADNLTMITWALILDICKFVVIHFNVAYDPANEFATKVHRLFDLIEEMIKNNLFYGDKDEFYRILELCSSHRKENSVIALIQYRVASLNERDKIEVLKLIMENYYKKEERSKIRLKALSVLDDVLKDIGYCNEDGIIENVLLVYLNHLELDLDVKCRQKAVQILARLDPTTLSPKKLSEIFDIFDRILNCTIDANSNKDHADYEDVKATVNALILIFNSKFMSQAAFSAVSAFKLLSSFINRFYNSCQFNTAHSQIKLQVFKFLLNFRANSRGEVTTSNNIRNGSYIYSSFVTISRVEMSPSVNPVLVNHLNLTSPPPSPLHSHATVATSNSILYSISFLDSFKAIINCLRLEKDWFVLKAVLAELAKFLKNKSILMHENFHLAGELCSALCDLASNDRLKNCQDFVASQDFKLSKADVQFAVFPALSSLVGYKDVLDSIQKSTLIKSLQNGLILVPGKAFNPSQCILSLSICAMEMQEAMDKCLPEILLKLSQISATMTLAIPKLKFLSNLILQPDLYQNFTEDQYMSIFAIALPYTNSNKFNEFTVTLAHRVIAMWFLKCRQRYRNMIVSYIIKGLQNNIMQENITLSQSNDAQRNRSSSLNTDNSQTHHKKLETRLSTTTSPPPNTPSSPFTFSFSSESVHQQTASTISHSSAPDCQMQESKLELIETCMDLLSSYTFGMFSNIPQKSTLFERIFDRSRSETWLIGHKLITISTSGCFSRAAANGLCKNCESICKSTDVTRSTLTNNDSDCELSSSGEVEKINRRRHQSEFQANRPITSKPLSSAYDDSFIGSHSISQSKGSNLTCCCWCQGWAELVIRRSTGNTTWLFKVQNSQGILPYSSSPPDDLPDLAALFSTLIINKPNNRSLNPVEEITSAREGDSFVPIDNDANETERASSTPPVFKRAASSPDIEPNSIFDEIYAKESTESSVVNNFTSNQNRTEFTNSPKGISRAASFGSKRSPNRFRTEATKSNEPKRKLDFDEPFLMNKQDQRTSKANIESKTKPPPLSGLVNQADYSFGHRDRAYTISQMSPAQDIVRRAHLAKQSDINSVPQKVSGLTPRYVFLQLYYNSVFEDKIKDKSERDKRMPIILPKTEQIERGLRNLDLITPYETHKIGVVYVGPGQNDDKAAILSNQYGSSRYIGFLRGMGTFIKLEDVDVSTNFLGGLDTKGNDGKYALSWQDNLTQVIFHVATLMPTKQNDPNCNEKKRHIGNDHVCIVYNDSGKEFELATIKGEFIQAVIVIEPYEYSGNLVTVQTKEDFSELIGHFDCQMISDSSLPFYVRQLAIHANLGATVNNKRQGQGGQHISNWVQRLKQIKRIKERVTNTSGTSLSSSSSKTQSDSNEGVNTVNQVSGDNKPQYINKYFFPDFNDYS